MNKLRKAQRRLHRIAWKIYYDLVSQLNPIPISYMKEFDVLYRILTQKRDDTNKVYSVHEPEVLCISKGKEHKPYEFGNESSFAYTRESGIIVGAMAVDGNAYGGHILEPQLDQMKELTGSKIKKAIVDRGYKVKGGIKGVDIVMPKTLKKESYYLKKKREERCRLRAGIEGLISHLKHDHRLLRNYLSGTAGDKINTLLAAAAYNMKKPICYRNPEIDEKLNSCRFDQPIKIKIKFLIKLMRLEKQKILTLIFGWIYRSLVLVPVNIQSYRINKKLI